jgi:hypothetical protein
VVATSAVVPSAANRDELNSSLRCWGAESITMWRVTQEPPDTAAPPPLGCGAGAGAGAGAA